MSKPLLIALANAATALANVALQVAQGETTTQVEVTETEAPATPATGRRGRPRKEEPAEPEQVETKGKTLDELKAIIKPAIDAAKGADVKALIAKFAGEGKVLKDLAELPQHHDAFEKAVSALTVASDDDY